MTESSSNLSRVARSLDMVGPTRESSDSTRNFTFDATHLMQKADMLYNIVRILRFLRSVPFPPSSLSAPKEKKRKGYTLSI